MKILISGGLGFIGSRIAKKHLLRGDAVTIVDCLHKQVHQSDSAARDLTEAGAEVVIGKVEDVSTWNELDEDIEMIYHMAAETGTGQSMSEVVRYCDANVRGTAILCEVLAERPSIGTVVLPSSRAVYGEGLYMCVSHGPFYPQTRSLSALEAGDFSIVCTTCGALCDPVPTPESAEFRPASIYASTKAMQEWLLTQTVDRLAKSLRIMRYQNVYGPGQSLHNPYTGVLSIFARKIADGEQLDIFEDGKMLRDFVYIDDVVELTIAIAHSPKAGRVTNVGTGQASDMLDVMDALGAAFDRKVDYHVSGNFRFGDVRNAFADIGLLESTLGLHSFTSLKTGIGRLVKWLKEQREFSSI
mgnify:CR=1 FL=1